MKRPGLVKKSAGTFAGNIIDVYMDIWRHTYIVDV